MGTPAFNLVIVEGSKKELDEFGKTAYKNDSEAFCMEQLLPLPEYLAGEDEMSDEVQAFNYTIYGSKWVAAFGILIEKTDSYLKYYFNSKYTKAKLDYIAIKYNKLKFIHVFVEIENVECGLIEYKNGKSYFRITANDENTNWRIASDRYTYLYIEELYHKIMLIRTAKPEIFDKFSETPHPKIFDFYKFFNKSEYLRENESYYDSLYRIERELESRELDYARNGTAYPFRTNDPSFQLQFIKKNYLPSEKKKLYLKTIKNKNK